MSQLILTLIVLVGNPVLADEIAIKADTDLRLAHGVDPLTEQGYEQCIDTDLTVTSEDGTSQTLGSSAVHQPLRIEQVTTYEQLDEYSSQSYSGKAKASFASGDYSHSERSDTSLFSDRVAVGIVATADYGRYLLVKEALKPELNDLAIKDRAEFYRRCGTEYVIGYRAGQGVRVLMTAAAQTSKSFEDLKTTFNLGVRFGTSNGDLHQALESTAQSLLKVGRLQINFYGFGTGELRDTAGILASEQDPEQFRNVIAAYASRLDAKAAVKTHYITKPYFADERVDIILRDLKKKTISRLFNVYRQLASTRERILDVLGRGVSEFEQACRERQFSHACSEYVTLMKQTLTAIESKIEVVQASAQTCLRGHYPKECQVDPRMVQEIQNMIDVTWPTAFRQHLIDEEIRRITEESPR